MTTKAKQRALKIILILCFLTGVGLFLAGALRENIVYFKTPSELLQMQEVPKTLRLGGLVVKGSLHTTRDFHQFMVTDNTTEVIVHYAGRLPDLFREEQGVVAIGHYDAATKIFTATQLLAKHDQYYRPKY